MGLIFLIYKSKNKIMRFLFLILLAIPFISFSQNDSIKVDSSRYQHFEKDKLKVFLKTDVNYASSTSDPRKNAQSATGTLGIKFENGYLYGSSVFTIHSQNEQISTLDSSETKLFGSSLLLPQNSSSNISNFELQLGAKSFYELDSTNKKFLYKWCHPIGAQASFRVNNTIWQKSTISLPITIASFSFDINYRVLDVEMVDTEDRIKLIISGGYNTRRLGGDYGLTQNSELRKEFLGTDKLGFDAFKFSTRLEVSKFYGQIDLTSFGKKYNIPGFSGHQAVITLGIRADLQLPTKVK